MRTDDALIADYCIVKDNGAHPNNAGVINSTAMQNRTVANCNFIANYTIEQTARCVNDCAVLNVRA